MDEFLLVCHKVAPVEGFLYIYNVFIKNTCRNIERNMFKNMRIFIFMFCVYIRVGN